MYINALFIYYFLYFLSGLEILKNCTEFDVEHDVEVVVKHEKEIRLEVPKTILKKPVASSSAYKSSKWFSIKTKKSAVILYRGKFKLKWLLLCCCAAVTLGFRFSLCYPPMLTNNWH